MHAKSGAIMRWFVKLIVATAVLTLAACGGGGGGGGGGGSTGGGGGVAPVRPTAAEASRFLTQSTFGPTTDTITAVQNSSIAEAITQQFGASSAFSYQTYLEGRLTQLQAANPANTLNATHFYEAWFRDAATGPDQLRQRVAFALSQIFVISLADSVVDVRGAGSYYDMLKRNSFGNFRTLLEDVTLHPMMGRYLTYLANQREDAAGTRTPDENYAREVMQLMTIGLFELNANGSQRLNAQGQPIATYTSADISGLAKVFTGLSWYSPTPSTTTFSGGNADVNRTVRAMSFYPQFHSISEKRFLGVTIPATTTPDIPGDLRIALDTLFNHPNVGPFIASRLIQQLVTSNPSPAYIGRVSAVFANNGSGVRGDLGAVVRAILTDSEARDATAVSSQTFGKLREPLIRLTTWMRAFNATSASGNWLVGATFSNQSLGQSPLASPSVFNFWRPGFVPPAATELGTRNLFAPEMQIVDEVSVAGYLNTMQSTIDAGIGTNRDVRSAYAAEIALADNASDLVDRVNLLLTYNAMTPTMRQRVLDAVNAIVVPTTGAQTTIDTARLNRVKTAIFMTIASPDFIVQR